MSEKVDLFLSVVAVLYDHAGIVEPFVAELQDQMFSRYSNVEIILVDDNSNDDTVGRVKSLLARYTCLRLIPLSRTMEPEIALVAGLESAIGDFVVSMHPDFDPPSEIPIMVKHCMDGHDVVVGVTDTTRGRSSLYRFLRSAFYGLARWLVRAPLIRRSTVFRVFSRQALNAFTRVRSRRREFALVISDIGYGLCTHPYVRISRSGAQPGLGVLQAVLHGFSLLVHSSNRPLRFVSVLGVLGSVLSFAYAIYVIAISVLKQHVAEGWTTLSLQTSGLFFLVFLMLALLGEYVARMLEEVSDRPLYNVRNELNSSVMITDQTRRNVLGESTGKSALTDPPPASRPES